MKDNLKNKIVYKITKWRLFSHIFLVFLPILLLSIYFDFHIRQQVKEKVVDNYSSVLKLLSEQHQKYINDGEQLLHVLADSPTIIEHDIDKCNQYLAGLKNGYPFYADIALLNADGQHICGASYNPKSVVNVGLFREYFSEAVHTKKFTMSEYTIGVVSRKAVIILAQPVLDAEQNVSGVLLASLDLQWINKSISEFKLPSNRSLLLVDKDGKILGGFWSDEKLIGQSMAGLSIFQEITRNSDHGSVWSNELGGMDKLIVYTKLDGLPQEHPIFVVLGIPEQEINASTRNMFYGLILMWALALISTFYFIHHTLNFLVSKNIERKKK